MQKTEQYDVVIIGAGAAGLFCASVLGKSGLKVVVLDNGKKIGRKILMSGGGNCNFTNLDVTATNYICSNPHFVKSALARYTQWDFIHLVTQHNITYHEKELGQLFCDNGAQHIVNMLQDECLQGNVQIRLRQQVKEVTALSPTESDNPVRYQIDSKDEQRRVYYQSSHLVIATGGLSMPALGATPFGYQIAEQFGMKVLPPRASLVPFTYREKDQFYTKLAGLSLSVTATAKSGHCFTNKLLFTHRGLSGPAILQITNYWLPNETVEIDLLPNTEISEFLLALRESSPKIQLKTALCRLLPKRLVEVWAEYKLFDDKMIAQLSKQDLQQLTALIHHWQFDPNGTEGYRTAEVTFGGVDCDAISSKTMQSDRHSGLYFIGEVLDVTGWLGGYNFQWAWSSAYACATAIIND